MVEMIPDWLFWPGAVIVTATALLGVAHVLRWIASAPYERLSGDW